MYEKYDKLDINVWTPLIGFDKENPENGVNELLERMNFKPDAVSAFLFHIDVIMQHDGLEVEKKIPPDCCSYYGSPRNGIRERQDWTNQDLQKLIKGLEDNGIETYMSIMGNVSGNTFHDEWIYDHDEVIFDSRDGKDAYNVLRRMKDGSYFEDLFIEKLCKSMLDYGFTGFLPTDNFCPLWLRISLGDFSSDMLEQFIMHTNIQPTDEILKGLGNDSPENKNLRGDWLWGEHRIDWIKFLAYRWGVFWKKVCDRLHAIGKKVMSLGIYCTDPFETLYCLGIDLRLFEEAGIDGLKPNIVPTGLRMEHPDRKDPFFEYMAMLPLISAITPKTKLYTMLGVRDDTEEWDTLHHAPCCVERDIYTMMSFMRTTPDGLKKCSEGFFVCLGDSLRKDDWKWLLDRFDASVYNNAKASITPTIIWSDYAFDALLPDYIETRRWSTHKYMYEIAERGTLISTAARMEDIDYVSGTIFVPNFDLMSEDEKKKIASYNRGAVVCTAMAGFSPKDYGISADIMFEDKFSNSPAMVFAYNTNIDKEIRAQIEELCNTDDGKPNLPKPFNNIPESDKTILDEKLKFAKVTSGFADALSLLLRRTGTAIFNCNLPIFGVELDNGKYRLNILNPSLTTYGTAIVTAVNSVKDVEIKSMFPVLPVKYMSSEDQKVGRMHTARTGNEKSFKVKVAPGGMAVLEIELN